jgi:ankyrin repeat protein
MKLNAGDERAQALMDAIQQGDLDALRAMLEREPELAGAVLIDERREGRSLLHIATDWPGRFPNVGATIALLAAAGSDPNAAFQGRHSERPLHWAASTDDVEAIDALLGAGADIEAPGAIFTGAAPMSDAVVFAQWKAARLLLERGARTTFWQAAALGLVEQVEQVLAAADPPPTQETVTNALWHACRGGQLATARLLCAHGADPEWVGWDKKTPLDVARESGNQSLVEWLLTAQKAESPGG